MGLNYKIIQNECPRNVGIDIEGKTFYYELIYPIEKNSF
jgi:hypothetical protein